MAESGTPAREPRMVCPRCGKGMVMGELRVRGTCGYCWEIEFYEDTDEPPRAFRPATLKIRDLETKAYWCPDCEMLLTEYGKRRKVAKEPKEIEETIGGEKNEKAFKKVD